MAASSILAITIGLVLSGLGGVLALYNRGRKVPEWCETAAWTLGVGGLLLALLSFLASIP